MTDCSVPTDFVLLERARSKSNPSLATTVLCSQIVDNIASVNGIFGMTEKLPQRPLDDARRSMLDNLAYSCLIEMAPRWGHTKHSPTYMYESWSF